VRRYTIIFVDGEGHEHTATREADDSTLLAFGRIARQLADEYGPHASVRSVRLADEPDTLSAERAVNYDAKTGDTIAVKLPGWPAEGYFRVLDTTPERVKLAEVKHVTQKTPDKFAGMWGYEQLRDLGATYAEG
jgi:hypothetical protein